MSLFRFFSGFLGYLFRGNIYSYGNLGGFYSFSAPIRTSKLSSPTTSYPSLLYNQQTLEQYLAILDMLSEVYMFSIAGVVTRYMTDVVMEAMRERINVTVLSKSESFNKKATDFLSSYFKDTSMHEIIQRVLPDVIYYGSFSFYLNEDYELVNLYDPHCSIVVRSNNYRPVGYIVNGVSGMVLIPVDQARLFTIGQDDLFLYSDLIDVNHEKFEETLRRSSKRSRVAAFASVRETMARDEERGLFRKYVFTAPTPLFYYTRMQLREYIVKQIVLALTTLRDLLFPLVYTLQYDYPAVAFTVENLADRIEDILNEYVDISGFVGVKGNLAQILNMITYSIRVLPDFKGSIANLNAIDTNVITQKLDKYKGDLDELSNKILEDIGVPLNEKMTYWETAKQNERAASKINSITLSIDSSLTNLAKSLLAWKFPNVRDYVVDISLFDLSYGKLVRLQNAVSNINEYLDSSINALRTSLENITDETLAPYLNNDKVIELLQSNLRHVFFNINELIDWNIVKKKMEHATKAGLEALEEESIEDYGDEDEAQYFGIGEEESPEAEEEEIVEEEGDEESETESE